MGPLLEELISTFQEEARSKNVLIVLEKDPNLPQSLVTDRARLRQVLLNLIGNAIKFTTIGSVCIKARTIGEQGSSRQIQFLIEDSGIGMSDEEARKLFEPFAQADSSTTRSYGGTGLGLVLSRRIARALRGDVTLERCAPGKGCTFSAVIEARIGVDVSPCEREPFAPELLANGRQERILVVDDAADNRLLVELVLSEAGMEVDTATNGLEATQKAEANVYDVILMDMQMPVLDGYAATRYLRERGYTRPILALSAHAMAEDRKKNLEAGCDAHLSKPLDAGLLIRKIKEYVALAEHTLTGTGHA